MPMMAIIARRPLANLGSIQASSAIHHQAISFPLLYQRFD